MIFHDSWCWWDPIIYCIPISSHELSFFTIHHIFAHQITSKLPLPVAKSSKWTFPKIGLPPNRCLISCLKKKPMIKWLRTRVVPFRKPRKIPPSPVPPGLAPWNPVGSAAPSRPRPGRCRPTAGRWQSSRPWAVESVESGENPWVFMRIWYGIFSYLS